MVVAGGRSRRTSRLRGRRDVARFAKAIDTFPTPIGLFNKLITDEGQGDALDLKKGGIFPIVHGARALALEKGLHETSTAGRLLALSELGLMRKDFVRELTDAFQFLMTLRLDAQLANLPSQGGGARDRRIGAPGRALQHGARPAARGVRRGEELPGSSAPPLQPRPVLMWRAAKRLFHQATIHDQQYRFLFKPGPEDEVVVLDTETTGLDRKTDDIVTIAAIKVRGDRILTSERFEVGGEARRGHGPGGHQGASPAGGGRGRRAR